MAMRRGSCLAGVVVLAVCGLGAGRCAAAGPPVPDGPSESPFTAELPRDGARVLDPRALAEAERLFRAAEGYDAAGWPERAYVCYLILRCRYRETAFGARAAAKAQQILEAFHPRNDGALLLSAGLGLWQPGCNERTYRFEGSLSPNYFPPHFFVRLGWARFPLWALPWPATDGGPGDPEREYRALMAAAADGGIARTFLLGAPADVAEVIREENLDLLHLVGVPLTPSDCAEVFSSQERWEQEVRERFRMSGFFR
jgi:hypothetical protein